MYVLVGYVSKHVLEIVKLGGQRVERWDVEREQLQTLRVGLRECMCCRRTTGTCRRADEEKRVRCKGELGITSHNLKQCSCITTITC